MEGRIRIGYFLEDRGHEVLLKAFVARMALSKGYRAREWVDDVRAATGSKSIQAYRAFLKDTCRAGVFPFDILIVASDGNCKGYLEKKQQLQRYAEKARCPALDRLVFAIPDPHIERWYLADSHAFSRAIGAGGLPALPAYKCKKGIYKKAMRDAVVNSEVVTQFGGYEYGEKIVKEMDLYQAGNTDPSLKHFLDELSALLTSIREWR